jgi:2-polyprenyl-3-methyl-5-hydroxy-6-metoxy-1,4-benzoquinol methylase
MIRVMRKGKELAVNINIGLATVPERTSADFERCKEELIEQTTEYIEANGGWRVFYELDEEQPLWSHFGAGMRNGGTPGVLTASIQSLSGMAQVIKKHGNNAYFLYYVYLGKTRGVLDYVFMNSSASRGAVKRIGYVLDIINEEYQRHEGAESFSITSLGGGLGFIESIIARIYQTIEVTIVDIGREIIRKGRGIAEANGLSDRVHFVHSDAETYISENEPVDMALTMGIIDYFQIPQAIGFMKNVRAGVKPGGGVVVTAVGQHRFSKLARTFGLSPVYKSIDDVVVILEESGYRNISAFLEPSGTITIAKARV